MAFNFHKSYLGQVLQGKRDVFSFFGDQKGSDSDFDADQELWENFQDTQGLLEGEIGTINSDYNTALDFAQESGQLERAGTRDNFTRNNRQLDTQQKQLGLFSSGQIDRARSESKDDMLTSLKKNMLGQRQQEFQLGKQRNDSIFGLKTSMQESYTSFLTGRSNLQAGDYDFDLNNINFDQGDTA